MAGLLPLEVLTELTSVGTLFAFSLVCLRSACDCHSIIMSRKTIIQHE